ncbi:2-isopropylmalate synthase [Celerinatantimonas sp. YJH-8]|uniref:2-isopropylmalate synthase n=1 Tax=Celerinatantimonas sp. YJH-8 TaxID=3228714 RepID=UPI0038C331F5
MIAHPETKYKPADIIANPDRRWPDNRLTQAPRWCSTDLRDGNQALAAPMDHQRKLAYFEHLVQCGFKEIEVAFPSASDTEYQFIRQLIEEQRVPEDVWLQVITQSRAELIDKTVASLQGAKKAIVHIYNATAPRFREIVFHKSKSEIIEMAVAAVRQVKTLTEQQPATQWCLQYSPETFCFTELDFVVELCREVKSVWQPTEQSPLIFNLPTTVEVNTPNVFADQIEQFCQQMDDLAHTTISVHPHNDRGTGVASAELALLAGADRVEGCLFGNGERTGNVDLVTLALNLYTQGVTPNLDFSDIRQTVKIAEHCNQLPVHPRHPYAGELVFTAFSGSHQDAIKKGFAHQSQQEFWDIPYLPLDPKDVGCSYEEVIRVNNQSGKSGAAWLLEQNHGLSLPRALQIDFSQKVKAHTDQSGKEVALAELWSLFRREYGITEHPQIALQSYESSAHEKGQQLDVCFTIAAEQYQAQGQGNGLLSALMNALRSALALHMNIRTYSEHTLGQATESKAVAYVEVETARGQHFFGVSIHADTSRASLQATLNAVANALGADLGNIFSRR